MKRNAVNKQSENDGRLQSDKKNQLYRMGIVVFHHAEI